MHHPASVNSAVCWGRWPLEDPQDHVLLLVVTSFSRSIVGEKCLQIFQKLRIRINWLTISWLATKQIKNVEYKSSTFLYYKACTNLDNTVRVNTNKSVDMFLNISFPILRSLSKRILDINNKLNCNYL